MSGYYFLKYGEFAYNKSYSVGYNYGSIKRLDKYECGALSTLYICFSLNKFNSDFIKVYFDSLKWYKEIYMIAAEGARNHGLLNIPTNDFFNTTHYLPKNPREQEKISEFILLLEKRIELQQQLIENLKLYKRGLISSLFNHKLLINKNCKLVKLGDIFNERSERANGNEELLAVTINNGVQKRNELELKDNSNENKNNYKKVYIHDIAYNTMRMWQGASGVSYYDGIVSPAYTVIYLKDNKANNINFWKYYLKEEYLINEFRKHSQGLTSDTWNLKFNQFSKIKVKIPNTDLQNKIASLLTEIDKILNYNQNYLINFDCIKKYLLQQMFI